MDKAKEALSYLTEYFVGLDTIDSRLTKITKDLPPNYEHIAEMAAILTPSEQVSITTQRFNHRLRDFDEWEQDVDPLITNPLYNNTKILVEYLRDKIGNFAAEKKKLMDVSSQQQQTAKNNENQIKDSNIKKMTLETPLPHVMVQCGLPRDINKDNQIFGISLRNCHTIGKPLASNIIGKVRTDIPFIYQALPTKLREIRNSRIEKFPGIEEISIFGGRLPEIIYFTPKTARTQEYMVVLEYEDNTTQDPLPLTTYFIEIIKMLNATAISTKMDNDCLHIMADLDGTPTRVTITTTTNYVGIFSLLPVSQQVCVRNWGVEISTLAYTYFRYGIYIHGLSTSPKTIGGDVLIDIVKRGHSFTNYRRTGTLENNELSMFGVTITGNPKGNILENPLITNNDVAEDPMAKSMTPIKDFGHIQEYITTRDWYLPYKYNRLVKDIDNEDKLPLHFSPENIFKIFRIVRKYDPDPENYEKRFNEIMEVEKRKRLEGTKN